MFLTTVASKQFLPNCLLMRLQVEHVKAACLPDKLNYPMLEEYDFRCPFACHYMGALFPRGSHPIREYVT